MINDDERRIRDARRKRIDSTARALMVYESEGAAPDKAAKRAYIGAFALEAERKQLIKDGEL